MIKISGDVKVDNGLSSEYIVTKDGVNNSIKVVEKFYEKKGKEKYFYSEIYDGKDGKVTIEAESVLGIDTCDNITPEESSLRIEFVSYDENKKDDVISNRIILINPHSEQGNVRFYVAKNIDNTGIQNLTFAFPTNVDYRQQLYNLYFGLIAVKGIDNQLVTLAGLDEELIPEKIGIFDASSFIANYGIRQIKKDSLKELKKRTTKK